jgi:hypothetical protein
MHTPHTKNTDGSYPPRRGSTVQGGGGVGGARHLLLLTLILILILILLIIHIGAGHHAHPPDADLIGPILQAGATLTLSKPPYYDI